MTTASRPIPGPGPLTLLRALPALAKDPFGFCMTAAANGDGLVRLGAGPLGAYLVSRPTYVRQILVTNAGNYVKGAIMDGIRLALGDGLFTSDGARWRRHRRLMQPAFHTRRIELMAQTIPGLLQEATDRWAPAIATATPVDLLRESVDLNTRLVLRTLFGVTVGAERTARLLDLTQAVFHGMTERVWTFFLPRWVPTPGAAAYQRAITALDTEIYQLITDRRTAGPTAEEDLLSTLLTAVDEETGTGMDDRQIRDEIFTLFQAGYESTASTVTWAIYLLARHPEAAARTRDELDAVLAGRTPTHADLAGLRYTRQVIDETLRLYPAFPMFFRSSVQADRLGPHQLPAGAQLVISPYATHHDPRYWNDPERFDPARFDPAVLDASTRAAYYPFGAGQRRCIGEAMSLTTSHLVLASLLSRYRLELTGDQPVSGHYAMTYQPAGGLPVLLRPR